MFSSSHRQSNPPAIGLVPDIRFYIYAGITGALIVSIFLGWLANMLADQPIYDDINMAANGYLLSQTRQMTQSADPTGGNPGLIPEESVSGMIPPQIIEWNRILDKGEVPTSRALAGDTIIYGPADSLDAHPEFIWMKYPEIATSANGDTALWQVSFDVLIGIDGLPLEADIITQSSLDTTVERQVKDAVMNAIFVPAMKNGNPVRCWIKLPVRSI